MRVLILVISYITISQQIFAHEIRPAYLHISQISNDSIEATMKIPTLGNAVPKISPSFPSAFDLTLQDESLVVDAKISKYLGTFTGSLEGVSISINGIEKTLIDVIVQIDLADQSHLFIIQADRPTITIPTKPSNTQIAKDYFVLGLQHIWEGIDHLLFVLSLLLIIVGFRKLLGAITAFTIAHSLTLAISSLDLIYLPSPPVEAVIALSIIFLAREYFLITKGATTLTSKHPWLIAFVFGLLHGFGFAGALDDIGLPHNLIFMPLLSFNLGIEFGQILFIVIVLFILFCLKRFRISNGVNLSTLTAYGIGTVASFWFIERILNF